MKIVFVAKYNDYNKKVLQSKLDALGEITYKQAVDFINNESLLMINFFYNYLNKIQNVNAYLVIPNWEWLEEKWSKENDIKEYESVLNLSKIHINTIQPDILFLNSNFEYYTDYLTDVKPNVKKICSWISCPLPEIEKFQFLDHIFTIFPPHHDFFKSINIPTTLMNAGFDKEILKRVSKEKNIDISFIGGISSHHKKRIKYLKYLVKYTPIQLWGYGFTSENKIKNFIKQKLFFRAFSRRYKGQAFGIEMFQILSSSKITFNCHGDIAANHSVNIRLFEATGTGSLLITELTPNIEKLFTPGKEIVCYKTIEEAKNLIEYYLKNDRERELISAAGQQKTLNSYSYESITENLHLKFQQILSA